MDIPFEHRVVCLSRCNKSQHQHSSSCHYSTCLLPFCNWRRYYEVPLRNYSFNSEIPISLDSESLRCPCPFGDRPYGVNPVESDLELQLRSRIDPLKCSSLGISFCN